MVGMEAVKALAGYFPQRQAELGLDGAALEVTAQDARARARAWQVRAWSNGMIPLDLGEEIAGTCRDGFSLHLKPFIITSLVTCISCNCGAGTAVASRHGGDWRHVRQRASVDADRSCGGARHGRSSVRLPRGGVLGGARCRYHLIPCHPPHERVERVHAVIAHAPL